MPNHRFLGPNVKRAVCGLGLLVLLALALATTTALWWASSDARLTQFVAQQVDGVLPGQVAVGRVHWAWPLRLTVHDVAVMNHPHEVPSLQLHSLTTRLSLRSLLRGRITLGPTTLDGLELYVPEGQPQDAEAEAAARGSDGPAQPDARTLSLDVSRALSRLPVTTVQSLCLRRGRLTVAGAAGSAVFENISAEMQLHADGHGTLTAWAKAAAADVSITQSGRLWQGQNITVKAQRLVLWADPEPPLGPNQEQRAAEPLVHLDIGEVALLAPGLDLTAAAQLRLFTDDSFEAEAQSALGITLDDPTVQNLFDGPARRALALTGGLRSDFTAAARGSLRSSPGLDSVEARLVLAGSHLGLVHIPITGAVMSLSWTAASPGRLDAEAQWDDASSLALTATVSPQAQLPGVGAHSMSLVVQNVALSDLIGRLQPLAGVVPAWREGLRDLNRQRGMLPKSMTLRLHGEGPSLWPDPRTRWAVTAQALGIDGTAQVPMPEEAQPLTLTAVATANSRGLVLEQMDVVFGRGRIMVHADGLCGWNSKEPARLKITADTLRLAALLTGAHAPLTASRLKLTLGLSGTPDAPQGKGALQLFAVNVMGKGAKPAQGSTPGGITLGNITLPMNFSGGTLMARGATLAGEAVQAGITGFVQLLGAHNAKLPKHTMNFEVRLGSPDVDALLGRPRDDRGPSRVSGRVLVGGTLEAPEVVADVRADGPLGRGTAWATATDTGAVLRKLTVAPAQGGVLWADGAWQRRNSQVALTLGGELPNAARNQTAVLSGSLQGALDSNIAVQLAAETPQSHLLASGLIVPHTQALDIQVATTAALAELAQWHPQWAAAKPTGHINGQIRMNGPWQDPKVLGTLLATGLGLSGRTLGSGRVQALVQTPETGRYHLELRAPKALEADVDVYPHARGGVRIEADIPHFAVAALYPPMSIAGADIQGDALVQLRLGKRTLLPMGTVTLRHLVASSRGQTMQLEETTVVRLDGKNMGIGRMRISGKPGRLALEGHLGNVVRASVAGHVALSFVTPFVPALTYARGELTLDAKVYGPRQDPQVEAHVQVTQPMVIRPRGAPIEVRLATGNVTLTPHKLLIENVRGGIEGGSFVLGGEVALKDHWPTAYALRLDGHGIPVRQGDLMVEGNVALACTGPGDHPLLKGTVDIIGGRYLRALELRDFSFVGQPVDVSLPAAYQAPWLKNVGLDVHTVSHDGVDIAINASAFAIRARVETDLHIGGNVLDPRLTGKVQAREGTIAFPRADLQLSQASIDFETSRRSPKNPIGAEVIVRAGGEVVPSGGDSENYQVSMNLDGPPEALSLDLSSDNGKLNKLAVLSLLSTGNVDLAAGAHSGDDAAKLETAEALVGSMLTAPLSRFAQKKLEQVFNVNVDLAIKTSDGAVTVVAAKSINRRIRLEGAYSHGVGLTNTDQSNISTKAQMALTNRLRLEGNAAQSLTGASQSASQSGGMQSNLELKYRLMGP